MQQKLSNLHGGIPLLSQSLEVFTRFDPDRHSLVDLFDGFVMLALNLRTTKTKTKNKNAKTQEAVDRVNGPCM
jgi:hypothetical protein